MSRRPKQTRQQRPPQYGAGAPVLLFFVSAFLTAGRLALQQPGAGGQPPHKRALAGQSLNQSCCIRFNFHIHWLSVLRHVPQFFTLPRYDPIPKRGLDARFAFGRHLPGTLPRHLLVVLGSHEAPVLAKCAVRYCVINGTVPLFFLECTARALELARWHAGTAPPYRAFD